MAGCWWPSQRGGEEERDWKNDCHSEEGEDNEDKEEEEKEDEVPFILPFKAVPFP